MKKEAEILMERIKESRFFNAEKEYNLCASLESYGRKYKDEYIMAFVYLYSGDALLTMGIMESAVKALQKGIEIQTKNNYRDLLPLSYNLMGEVYSYLRNEQMALNYFLKAIEYIDADYYYIIEAVVYTNVGKLYFELNGLSEAEDIILKAIDILDENTDKNEIVDEFFYNECRLVLSKVYVEMGDYTKARNTLGKITNKTSMGMDVLMTSAVIDIMENKPKVAYKKIVDLIDLSRGEDKNIHIFQVYKKVICALITLGKIDDIPSIIKDMKKATANIDIPGIWMDFLNCYIRYCKIIDDREGLSEAYKIYFEWNLIQEKISKSSEILILNGKKKLFEITDGLHV